MTISYALSNTIEKLFSEGTTCYYGNGTSDCNFIYESNSLFKLFFETTIKPGINFIPVLNLFKTITAINEWLQTDGNKEERPLIISMPLYTTKSVKKSGSEQCLRAIANINTLTSRLITVTTPKGTKYYGGGGIILNEFCEPLMLCGYSVFVDLNKTNCKVIQQVCYVAPRVFLSNDMLSKAIIKKCIPFISTNSMNNTTTRQLNLTPSLPRIIIEGIDHHFKTPNSYNQNLENINTDIWDFLNNNKDLLK